MNPAEVILREVPILTRADAPTAIDTPHFEIWGLATLPRGGGEWAG